MAKKVAQFRFYKNGDTRNYPTGVRLKDFTTGQVFSNYYPIKQLGIQALPGTEFYLNKGISPIVIGNTGIYELELNSVSDITNLNFKPASMNVIDGNPHTSLIVDIIYEKEDGVN